MILNNIDAQTLLQVNATIIAGIFILISIFVAVADISPPNYQDVTYLFTWNYTISGDSTNIPPKLKEYLLSKYSITWLNNATISINDTNLILKQQKLPEIVIELNNPAILKIGDKQIEEFNLKQIDNDILEVHYKIDNKLYMNIVKKNTYILFARVMPFIIPIVLIPFSLSILYIMRNRIEKSRTFFYAGIIIIFILTVVLPIGAFVYSIIP